jgi:hypothetical protein
MLSGVKGCLTFGSKDKGFLENKVICYTVLLVVKDWYIDKLAKIYPSVGLEPTDG